jgi:hypothetical protein
MPGILALYLRRILMAQKSYDKPPEMIISPDVKE